MNLGLGADWQTHYGTRNTSVWVARTVRRARGMIVTTVVPLSPKGVAPCSLDAERARIGGFRSRKIRHMTK